LKERQRYRPKSKYRTQKATVLVRMGLDSTVLSKSC
jgi:hypothetical protein